MPYDIYVLSELDVTVSGGGQLDGVTQGDGSHLLGATLTLNASNWQSVSINDTADNDFADNESAQRLNGEQTINGTTYSNNTIVEAEFGITVEYNGQTYQMVSFNVRDSNPSYATVEGLAFIGGPGGFPPVGYATPICFVRGTMIETANGPRRVEDIEVGDLVWTQNGLKPVRWTAERRFAASGARAPIAFAPGAIGNTNELRVSPQHRMLLSDWRAQLWCGEEEVLIPAKAFINDSSVRQVVGDDVVYHHFMFDAHQIVRANGVLCESFHPGFEGVDSLADNARDELFDFFPELESDLASYGPAASADVRGREARVVLAA